MLVLADDSAAVKSPVIDIWLIMSRQFLTRKHTYTTVLFRQNKHQYAAVITLHCLNLATKMTRL